MGADVATSVEPGLAANPLTRARSTRERSPLQRFLRNRAAAVGGVLVLIMVLAAVFAPLLAPYDPAAQDLMASLTGPSAEHLFGTDNLGRDIFSRVLYGGRVTMPIAFVGVAVAIVIGVPVGLMAGYMGRFADTLIMRLTDILLAFPSMLLAIAITSALGIALTTISIAIALFSIPVYIRLVRSEVLRLREREFVTAAHCIGAPSSRIVFGHILPNSLSPIIVQSSLNAAIAIITVSALSFIGLGAQPPTAEWGVMLADGRGFMRIAPWVTAFPGIAIVIVVLGFNLLGDGLRDAYDPRSRR